MTREYEKYHSFQHFDPEISHFLYFFSLPFDDFVAVVVVGGVSLSIF